MSQVKNASMRVEEQKARVFTIYDAPALDPITVILQDYGTGKGKLIFECFGEAWSAYWGAMGDNNITQFLLSCEVDYIVGKLSAPNMRGKKNLVKYVTRIVEAIKASLNP